MNAAFSKGSVFFALILVFGSSAAYEETPNPQIDHYCNEVCSLPKKVGPCEALIPRYFHNVETGKCEEFKYGGCEGNANNFETLEECENTCEGFSCCLPKKVGPCDGDFTRYYHNKMNGKCEQFSYGGCHGNANNFKTFDECRKTCGETDICSLPQDPGLCTASFNQFYYNKDTGNCEEFVYGGCGGNANNFETAEHCMKRCGGSICSLPKDSGPCAAYFQHYYYNRETGKCEEFIYGGCHGNANNFETNEDCERKCGGKRYHLRITT